MGTSVSDSGFFRMPLQAAAIRLCERVMLCMVAGVDGEGEGLEPLRQPLPLAGRVRLQRRHQLHVVLGHVDVQVLRLDQVNMHKGNI